MPGDTSHRSAPRRDSSPGRHVNGVFSTRIQHRCVGGDASRAADDAHRDPAVVDRGKAELPEESPDLQELSTCKLEMESSLPAGRCRDDPVADFPSPRRSEFYGSIWTLDLRELRGRSPSRCFGAVTAG